MDPPTLLSHYPETEAELQALLAQTDTSPGQYPRLRTELEAGYIALTASSPDHLVTTPPAR